MFAQRDDEALDVGLEKRGEDEVVPVVELLREAVPQVERDVRYLVVWMPAAEQDRVEDGHCKVRVRRRRVRGYPQQDPLGELCEDAAQVDRLEDVFGGHRHVVRLLQLAHSREEGQLEPAAATLLRSRELLHPLQQGADGVGCGLVNVGGLVSRGQDLKMENWGLTHISVKAYYGCLPNLECKVHERVLLDSLQRDGSESDPRHQAPEDVGSEGKKSHVELLLV